MSPAEHKRILREAAYYQTLPQHVLNDLMKRMRRQDFEEYQTLRQCLRKLRKKP